MEQVQALIIKDNRRTVTLVRRDGELLRIEGRTAIVLVDGEEIPVPVHLVRDLDRPDILRSAITQMSTNVLDDHVCLVTAVGELIERSEPIDTGEHVVTGDDYDRMVDAWVQIAVPEMLNG